MRIKITSVNGWVRESGNHVISPSDGWGLIDVTYGYVFNFNCDKKQFLVGNRVDNRNISYAAFGISGYSILWMINCPNEVVTWDFAFGVYLVIVCCVSLLDCDNINVLVHEKFPNIFALNAASTFYFYLSYSDVVDWSNYCRAVCLKWADNNLSKLGGGIERGSRRIFIVPVADRAARILIGIIKNWIEPGTTIM